MATEKIKCSVEGIIDLDRLLGIPALKVRDIINTREFQRLRHIAQLGFAQYVYPGANHTRLSHSLGTFQGCQKALQQLKASGVAIPDEWYNATALAALLHDIGHGPFSHVFEEEQLPDHDQRTREIINSGPELPGILNSIDPSLKNKIIQVLNWEIGDEQNAYLSYLVSSQLDCDRIDYLRRDSLHSGAGYGNFDRDWLLRALKPSPDRSSVLLSPKGIHAAEQYLIGRYHMYKCVYFHKTVRAFECAFRGLCKRLKSIERDLPEIVSLYDAAIPLNDYLKMTDVSFLKIFSDLIDDEDATVKLLAKSIIHRKPLAYIESINFRELSSVRDTKIPRATDLNFDPDCVIHIDEPSDTPYKPYEPDPNKPQKGIRVFSSPTQFVDITDLSDTIREMKRRYYIERLYFPRDL